MAWYATINCHLFHSRYVMNLLMIALRNNPKWCKEILQNYEVIELINQRTSRQ